VSTFEAKFGGICGSCTERIHIGDPATYAGDTVVHASCDDTAQPERKTETCPDCWLTKPCDCEER
jgi:hypothetical protein